MKHLPLLMILCLAFFIPSRSWSQDDSCHLRISLLTCSPGQELYSTFGHTAIRVIDSTRQLDVVFNYGTFDDSDPQFYAKFTRGIMRYALSDASFTDFMMEYQEEHRSVVEQVLDLNCAEKQQLLSALIENLQGSNRFYQYYFLSDNCTTRARDMIVKNAAAPVHFKNILPRDIPSFRDLIHSYLDQGREYWSELGIDFLLGSHLDKKVGNEQAMFLPEYLMKGFDSAQVQGRPLVLAKRTILEARPPEKGFTLLTPSFLFTGLFLLIGLLTLGMGSRVQILLNAFDCLFFLSLGLLGILMAYLWIVRVDTVCRNNYNLLWALPTHTAMAFLLFLKKKWVRIYFRIVFLLTVLLTLAWLLIPQQLNIAVLPILGIIMVRSFYRTKPTAYGP